MTTSTRKAAYRWVAKLINRTKDSDPAADDELLAELERIAEAMEAAGRHDAEQNGAPP